MIYNLKDFLGQITLKLNDLNVNGEHIYQLKPRNNKETVTGTITLLINMSSHELDPMLNQLPDNKTEPSFFEQYRALHMHIFEHLTKRAKTLNETNIPVDHFGWFFESIEMKNNASYFQGNYQFFQK